MFTTYIAIDIEKAGCLISKHPIVSIGYCIGNDQGDIYKKGKINLKVEWPYDFEPRCWNSFWSKQSKEMIDNLKENAVEQRDGFVLLNDMISKWERDYETIVYLSDNPSFDIANIDYNLEKYCDRKPLRYSSKDESYQNVISTDDLFYSLNKATTDDIQREFIEPFVKHDHDPANDAEVIYRQYIGYKLHSEHKLEKCNIV